MADGADDQFETPLSRARRALSARSRSTSTSEDRRYRRSEPDIGSPSQGGSCRTTEGVQAEHTAGPLIRSIRLVPSRRARGCTIHSSRLFASRSRLFGAKLWRRASKSTCAPYDRRTQLRSTPSCARISQDGNVYVYSV